MKKHTIYTRNFGLVCLSSLLFSSSFNMLIPELPEYLSSIDGAEYKGLIISLFTLTAGISRPFSGILTDTIGRKPVMIIGATVCVVCGFLYPFLGTISGFLFLRLLHGFSTGFTPTAIATYVADVIPYKQRGEAIGIQGLCFSTGFAIGPAIGSFIQLHYSFDTLFYCSSLLALLTIIIVMRMKETLQKKKQFHISMLKISKKDSIAIEVLPAAIITLLSYIGFGVVLTLIPDITIAVGGANKGLFFIIFTITSILIRFIAGKASDRYRRIPIVSIGLVVLLIALLFLGGVNTVNGLILSASLYGISMGILSPALGAWTIDLSHPNYRGKAMATMYIALEIGIGLGALFSGWYYQDMIHKVPMIMYISAFMVFIALLYVIRVRRNSITKS